MQPHDRLTLKEIEVARLVWQGLTNRDIASAIGTTEQVVKNYLRSIFDKLGVWSRLELAMDAGGVGTFDWDVRTGALIWDHHQERLFGFAPGEFDGSTTPKAGVWH